MSDPNEDEQRQLAPPRPLTGPVADQQRGSTAGSDPQATMAIPVITDAPQPQSRTPKGPQPGPSRPANKQAAPRRPDPSAGDDTARRSPRPATPAQPSAAPGAASVTKAPRTRKARLRLTRLDPWSVMKMAFALSMALAIVIVVSVAIVWSVLEAAGVWESINSSVGSVLSEDDSSSFDITDYIGTSRVLGLTTIIAAANVVLLTAIATLGAFLYNLAASLLGGLEVTLAEDVR